MIGVSQISVAAYRGGGGAAPVNLDFVSTWDTTLAGSASDTVVLPLLSGGTYSGTIDWGDGSTSALSYANRTHTYASGGVKVITISGQIDGWRFGNGGDRRKITDIFNWGTLNITTDAAFQGCNNLDITATDAPTISSTSLAGTFMSCTSLTTPDLSSWDVSSVTDMFWFFLDADDFNGDISTWDVSNVTNMEAMFGRAKAFNQDIGNWNVSSVTNMRQVFLNARAFNQPIGSWNISSVTDMSNTFSGAISFNQPIGSWNTSSVTNMSSVFQGATSFNQPIESWNTSSVTDMSRMFSGASSFNQPLGNWDVSSVTNMFWSFLDAVAFNQPLNNWDVGSVTIMQAMFGRAYSFDQDISSWDINQVTDFTSFMVSATGLSTANYDALLIGWDAQGAMSYSGTVNFGGSKYTAGGAAEAARTSLISKWGGITDGGPA